MSKTVEELEATQAPEAPAVLAAPAGPSLDPSSYAPLTSTPDVTAEVPVRVMRPAVAAAVVTAGTGFLVGGMFTGAAPRVLAAIAAVGGVLLAVFGSRSTWRPTISQILSLVGIFVLGLLALMMVDAGGVGNLGDSISRAIKGSKLRRPPVQFEPGWRPLLVWTLASIGYAVTWLGIEGRSAAKAILIPLPIIAFSAIAQPPEEQAVGGIVALVSFVIALAVIFRPDEGGTRMPSSFELKRAARSAPLIVVLVAVLAVLGQTNILFPAPLYDPTQKAVLPKAVPLSDVVDRVLFTTQCTCTGPWRTGVLDVYDGEAWRLPPYSASRLVPVPTSGIIDPAAQQQNKAHIEIAGLDGTVLPVPARAVGIRAEGPSLVTDSRSSTVRVQYGEIRGGLVYDVTFALLPTEADLAKAPAPPPQMQEFIDAPAPPPAVKRILDQTTGTGWTRLNTIRKKFLDEVAVKGSGLPVPVPPDRVADMVAGSKEGTPFEIVAAQALIARWSGVPARIGYGFDKGDAKGAERTEIRPKHGSLWLEVWFQGHGWLPVTGQPRHAKKSLNNENVQVGSNLIPTDDVAVDLYLPLRIQPQNIVIRRVQIFVLLGIPVVLLGALFYSLWPAVVKARRRGKRRQWALKAGPRARVATAYAEFRDLATDLGVGDPHATPLAFVDLVVPDEEHTELAWLVTRTLWGDLVHGLGPEEVFAAEELSRALRRRIFEAQPITIRLVAFISRLSMREQYAPSLPPFPKRARKHAKEVSDAAVVSA